LLEGLSYKRADAASAISAYSKTASEKLFHPKKPIVNIHYGIPFIEAPIKERDKDLIVFAGSLVPKKGVIQLVQAAGKLYVDGIRFKLRLYGKEAPYEGATMSEYLRSIMPKGMEDDVIFYGHVDRQVFFDAYSHCTMAVFPSQWESFGLTPIEAMMHGCAVIHTTIPTGYELIDDGINGLLVDPYDVNVLSEKMRLLLTDETLRKKLGENGIVKVKNTFTLDVMCNKLLAFYAQTIKEFKSE
ncbi:MAG: glycosyltransferase, partial [Bacteroidota bacterium]|nr:glycosyltransferase [Bacteroidota bacterium]